MEIQLLDMGNEIRCNSNQIAFDFEKRHDHVIRDIENRIKELENISPKLGASYYKKNEYLDTYGRTQKEYLMNRNGFTFLVMSYTGKKATQFQVDYINAFNKMEELIRERLSSEWLETRAKGKLIRRDTTDAIKELIEYAKENGSQNSLMFYTTYSKLVNSLVGIGANQREKAPYKTLKMIETLEDMISKTILYEVNKGTYYKTIYTICKSKGEQLIELTDFNNLLQIGNLK